MVIETPAGIKRVFRVPATSLSRNTLKAPVVANMIMLGGLWQATRIVSREALEKAITDSVPRGKDKLNLEAFALGARAVEDQMK
jgi:2-oxoglutarate ferredoxin oxidoreductase subunit gamma